MKTEQDLQQRLAQLPDSIEPPRDLWPELAARLAQTPQLTPVEVAPPSTKVQTGWWLAAAAAVLFTVWAPWQQFGTEQQLANNDVYTQQLAENNGEFSGSTTATAPVTVGGYQQAHVAGRVRASSETQWRLSNDYEQQRALQLSQIRQVPEVYQDWKQQLKIWRQATDLVLLALQYQPDEPGLLRQLSQLQQQELAYLQKVVLADQT
jgi:hypothetical protein